VLSVVWTMLAGAVTGCLGALLGIGGGVFLVPFLNLVLHLPFKESAAISLITVIATSSATSASPGRLSLVNLRLGMVLEIFTTLGGLSGVLLLHRFSDRALYITFGVAMALVSLVMVRVRDSRTSIPDPSADVGALGARYHDPDTNAVVAYRIRRVPVAFGVSYLAGVVSTLAGIGGGVLKVPALNAWCGVPMRAAAATSALMIGATAVVGALAYFARGHIVAPLAAAAALGVLVGSRIGFVLGARTRARGLKLLMAAVLAIVALIYFTQAFS
jgi:uncharacterized membrane protein YfcA